MPEPRSPRHLLAPVVGTGVFMAAYLLLRPYGDTGDPGAAAAAYASTWWVVAHLCGALALASFGRLALRLADVDGGLLSRSARTAALTGTVLVLPYYGAETFGLHAIGQQALAGDSDVLTLVDAVRNHPAALTTFGLGMLLLAVAGVLMAVVWQRRGGTLAWAAWPLGLAMAAVLPQFYLPPVGRMAFGLAYAAAAAVLLTAVLRAGPDLPRPAELRTRRRGPVQRGGGYRGATSNADRISS